MKKNIRMFIVLGIILLFILGLSLFLLMTKVNNKTISLKKEAKIQTKEYTELILDGGSKSELKSMSGTNNISRRFIMTGSDSYLNKKPSDDIIKENGLSSYVNKSKEYISNFEKEVSDNYKYKIKSVYKKDKQAQVIVTLTPYYYSVYKHDLDELQSRLLTMANKGDEASKYKAKVKAMQILDIHLDEYKNNNNDITVGVLYDREKSKDMQTSFQSYLWSVDGYYHSNEDIDALYSNTKERVDGYVSKAIESGILSQTNPLEL